MPSLSENLEKQILATVNYYDILGYPLTNFEICLYLIKPLEVKEREEAKRHSLLDIMMLLDESKFLNNHLDSKLGFYFLKDRGEIVRQRLDRKKIACRKWKKVKIIFYLMQIVPFLKMVLVSGSLSLGNCKEESDIDLIITAKKGRIWTVRTFITALTAISGARRHGRNTKDKICLNHYITDGSLKIPFKSLYNAQSYVHLVNVYSDVEDRELFHEFQKENCWIGEFIGDYKFSELSSIYSIKKNSIITAVSKFFEIVLSGKTGDCFESKLSKIQSDKIKKDPLCKKKGGRITIGDDQLEFHPDSHESHIIPEFNGRMEELGFWEFANQKDSGLNK